MRIGKFILSFCFFLMLILPGLQMCFGLFEEEKLHGVEEVKALDFPPFSPARFWKEDFQHALVKWFSHEFGFRGHLVRTDNQLNYSLFRTLSANYASPIVAGEDHMLFERLYIDSANLNKTISDRRLRRIATRLSRLQELLKARGIHFLLLITPSKATMYEEHIPPRYLKKRAADQSKSNYARLRPLLDEKMVNYFDTPEMLLRLKASSTDPLFARGGTHWTQLTACRVTEEMIRRIEVLMQRKLQTVQCEPTEERPIPEPFDRDLADLANLWHPEIFYERLQYPLLPDQVIIDGYQPRVLFTGGSFLWTILYYMEKFQTHSSREMFYYFSRNFRYPGGAVQELDRRNVDWEQLVFSNEVIIIEVNEANIDRIGAGFIRSAIAALEQ